MTSVAAYNYRGNTVAFVGTRNGKMKKVRAILSIKVVVTFLLFHQSLSLRAKPLSCLCYVRGIVLVFTGLHPVCASSVATCQRLTLEPGLVLPWCFIGGQVPAILERLQCFGFHVRELSLLNT